MAKAFALQPILNCTPGANVGEFHFAMFHGMQDPDSPNYRRSTYPSLGDSPKPFYLFHSGFRVPDVFEPDLNLIVSAKVKDALATLPFVAFIPVVLSKLIDMPYKAGDFSYRDRPPFANSGGEIKPRDILDQYPDDRKLHRGVPEFFEMLVPRLNKVRGPKTACKRIRIDCGDKVAIQPVKLYITAAVVEQYPILWSEAHIFSEQAFQLIQPFLDWDFFAAQEFVVD